MQDFFVTIGFLNPLIEWIFEGVAADTLADVTAIAMFIAVVATSITVRINGRVFWGFSKLVPWTIVGVYAVFLVFSGVSNTGKYVETSEAIALFADGEEEREIPVEIVRYRFIGTDQWGPWHVLK